MTAHLIIGWAFWVMVLGLLAGIWYPQALWVAGVAMLLGLLTGWRIERQR